MPTHKRVKDLDYDADELEDDYSDDAAEQETYAQEDRDNFASLTPVVRAGLEEEGLSASDKEIADALWHYYWDVGKSVGYLRGQKGGKDRSKGKGGGEAKAKGKTKFDEVLEKKAGDRSLPPPPLFLDDRMSLITGRDWFAGVPWSDVPAEMKGELVQLAPAKPAPRLLGGSSKLAKLAEERRKKAEVAKQETAPASAPAAAEETAMSALDRLSLGKGKEGGSPAPQPEPRKYPRKKREPTPPPPEPEPEPEEEEKEELPDLRAPPTGFGRTISTSPGSGDLSARMRIEDLLGSASNSEAFKDPSPDDVIRRAQSAAASKPAQPKATKELEKKTQNLKLDSEPPTAAPAQPKVKSKNMDVPKLWAESASTRRPSASFVVIGHVDHGKSTLMGRLLLDTGAVAQRDIDKYRKEATAMGKASFALAWVMDSTSDERERGVTVDIAQHHFGTDGADFTILDAPGHRDFVPSMLGGASMADLALLVVDANQLESGLKGQTREHCLLASAVGVKRMLVAVNKMDCTQPPWDEPTFTSVRDQIHTLLRETGFDPALSTITPCSGISGENVTKPPPASGPTAWVATSTPSLISALETSAAALPATEPTLLSKPLRLQLADVFHSSVNAQSAISVSGRLASGTVQPGEAIIILPSSERATVRSIEISDTQAPYAVAGQIATLHLDGDAESIERNLRAGDTLCAAASPARAGKEFTATVSAHETLLPSAVDVHMGRLHRAGRVVELIEVFGGKKKPRVVLEGATARLRVRVEGEEGVCAEGGVGVVLRSGGRTVGSGVIEG